MEKREIFRSKVENIELAWIPVSGGRKLAARLFLPKDAARKPVPCILE
jgi:predicted acyl esterase